MPSKKKKIVYVLDEDTWLNYLYKIDDNRKVLEDLLFNSNDHFSPYVKSMLCEYFSFLYNLEEVVNEMADEEYFDSETSSFVVTERQAMKFSLLLTALVNAKEALLNNNYSISLH